MTKADLIAQVAKKTKISQALAGRVVDAALGEIRTLLGKGGSISFTGFGSFSVTKRAKRKGRNPQTGEPRRWTRLPPRGGAARRLPVMVRVRGLRPALAAG